MIEDDLTQTIYFSIASDKNKNVCGLCLELIHTRCQALSVSWGAEWKTASEKGGKKPRFPALLTYLFYSLVVFVLRPN